MLNKMDDSRINSEHYWDSRFLDNWQACEGPLQSRFFARLAVENSPSWLIEQIRRQSLTLVDWGCAQGDGTDILASYFNSQQLVGVDFSAVAIEQATKRYPAIQFVCENWLQGGVEACDVYDVVFSSNTLEHFHKPYEVLDTLMRRVRKAVVLALPYRELERIDEHFYSFLPDNVPFALNNGFRLVWSRVIDCNNLSNTLWHGYQIFLVYAETSWLNSLNLVLLDAEVGKDDTTSVITSLNRAVSERDGQIASLNRAVSERDGQIASLNVERDLATARAKLMRYSTSWRLTRPLRFIARLARYGLTSEDRQALRRRYHLLPLPVPVRRFVSLLLHKIVGKAVLVIRRRALHTSKFPRPAVIFPVNDDILTNYIVWGVIDWHFRHQRPQQLSVALANTGRRVFYITPNFIDDEREGFEFEQLDDEGLLFQVKLFVKGAPVIYSSSPSVESIAQLRASIGEVLEWANTKQIISMVDYPFWYDIASVLPNSRLIYDCMDYHEGFGNNAESLIQLEKSLLSSAELTITTSSWLDNAVAPHARRRALIRNAGEYDHFCLAPESVYRDPQNRRIIGYYGAIAEWFDLDLIESVAKQYPDCCVLLIGADTVNARLRLAKLPNVTFTGEVSYGQLPYYLHGFDVCLLPFKVIPLTLATNPVKTYEYLSAGKPVVSVDLPEMTQFEGLVHVAADKNAFLAAVGKVLSQIQPHALVQQRKTFAQRQTWFHRAEALIQHAESAAFDPKVSVVVVTYNNLALTRACLASLDEHSQYENIEIIVVDNASSDDSPAFLSDWGAGKENRKLILNKNNRGFAAANNQGLEIASGDYLVLLNNDTYVTHGWARTLVRYLERDKTIGLIGPVTNNIGNEAKIDISYSNMDEMLLQSAKFTRRHIGQFFLLRTAAFFCVMMPRATYSRVGMLDEAFGQGFFEDDDYCRRIEQLGLSIVCAEDVFIHHHLSASFNKLSSADRQALFERNKANYEAKWGMWTPHAHKK